MLLRYNFYNITPVVSCAPDLQASIVFWYLRMLLLIIISISADRAVLNHH